MKAITYSQYGAPEVLRLQEIDKPVPGEKEVLVKIYATSVTAGDTRMRRFRVPAAQWIFARLYLGIFRPRRPVLGMELSGVVEATGNKVSRFKPGDEIYASTLDSGFGAYAEYKCFAETAVMALKPGNLSHLESATVPIGAGTALRFLEKGGIARGKKVLIFGASGSVGTYAVQLARHYGAEVTGSCSAANTGLVRSLGADHVVDYTKEEIFTSGKKYDLIFDAVGLAPRAKLKSVLSPGGVFVSVAGRPRKESPDDLLLIKTLIESGAIRPVLSATFPLEQIAEAHRLADTGRKRGNIGISVIPSH